MQKQSFMYHYLAKKNMMVMLFMLLIFGFVSTTEAHKVTVFAWVEDTMVYTESKLGGGKRVIGGDIFVYDENEILLLQGKTNDQGEFSFRLPKNPPLSVELNAGMGHMARWTITPEDVGLVEPNENITETKTEKAASDSNPREISMPGPKTPIIYPEELEALIERSVDRAMGRKLKPVMKILSDMNQEDPSISDIMGGIGYILGLVGLVAFFRARPPKA